MEPNDENTFIRTTLAGEFLGITENSYGDEAQSFHEGETTLIISRWDTVNEYNSIQFAVSLFKSGYNIARYRSESFDEVRWMAELLWKNEVGYDHP